MKLIKINVDERSTLELPLENVLRQENENRVGSTPYTNEFKIKENEIKFNSDFKFRLQCYKNIYEAIKGEYKSSLDIFGGVGITAKLYDAGEAYVNDIDKDCLNILRKNFEYRKVYSQQVGSGLKLERKFNLILADFNDFTLNKFLKSGYRETLLGIFEHAEKFVIINDCSVFYLRYGKSSYENYKKLLPDLEFFNRDSFLHNSANLYCQGTEFKPRLIETFNNSSFILFEKDYKGKLQINRVTSHNQVITTKIIEADEL